MIINSIKKRIFVTYNLYTTQDMEVTVKKVEITLPEVDMALLKELAKKFGWNIGRKKSGIEKGLEDIKAGRVYKAKDMEDLKKHLLNQ